MASSIVTKKALVKSFKKLISEQSFNKITVADICDGCSMNRKSFYYHFEDKYALVNWIFKTECLDELKSSGDKIMHKLETLCVYFYDNRDFYHKIFKVAGQNSFTDYFREIIEAGIRERLIEIMTTSESVDFCTEVFTDTVISVIRRWISKKNPIEPEEFVRMLENLITGCAIYINDHREEWVF